MKKIVWTSIIGSIIVISVWVICFYLSDVKLETKYLLYGDDKNGVDRLNATYVALGALFTAFAFGGTLCSIIYQHKTTLRKTSLDVFTRVYSTMQDEPQFNKIFNYILHDLKNENKTIEELKTEPIIWTKDGAKQDGFVYPSIMYFCNKMEYIGVLLKHKYIDISLLYQSGGRVFEAYNILQQKAFFEGESRRRYLHFIYLAYLIDKSRNKYMNYCDKIEKNIKKHEEKKTN